MRDRRLAQLDIYQALQTLLFEIRRQTVRATLEIDPSKRQWQNATAIYFPVFKELANLDA